MTSVNCIKYSESLWLLNVPLASRALVFKKGWASSALNSVILSVIALALLLSLENVLHSSIFIFFSVVKLAAAAPIPSINFRGEVI